MRRIIRPKEILTEAKFIHPSQTILEFSTVSTLLTQRCTCLDSVFDPLSKIESEVPEDIITLSVTQIVARPMFAQTASPQLRDVCLATFVALLLTKPSALVSAPAEQAVFVNDGRCNIVCVAGCYYSVMYNIAFRDKWVVSKATGNYPAGSYLWSS